MPNNFLYSRTEWKPKENEEYWIIKEDGEIIDYLWVGTEEEKARLEFGNAFKSFRQAEKAREEIKSILYRFNKRAAFSYK